MPDVNPYDALFASQGEQPQQSDNPKLGVYSPGESINPYDSLFDQAEQQIAQSKPSNSTFMDAVEGFNRSFGEIAEAGLQPAAMALDKLGITNTAQARLEQLKKQRDLEYEMAKRNSPIAARAGRGLGAIGAAVTTAPMIPGGAGAITGSAGTALGRTAEMGALGVSQGILGTYGDPETRVKAGLTTGALNALGQGAGELASKGVQGALDFAGKLTPKEALKYGIAAGAGAELSDLDITDINWKDLAKIGGAVVGAKLLSKVGAGGSPGPVASAIKKIGTVTKNATLTATGKELDKKLNQ